MERKDLYSVLKLTDVEKYLGEQEKALLKSMIKTIRIGRRKDGKDALECVVVEEDWPEYESTWDAIEKRVNWELSPTYFKNEKCDVRKVIVEVGPTPYHLMWYAKMVGTERRALEVTIASQVFLFDNEDGKGFDLISDKPNLDYMSNAARLLPDNSEILRLDDGEPINVEVKVDDPIMRITNTDPTVVNCPTGIRYSLLNELRAFLNHDQTLTRLNERGGMCPSEVAANLKDVSLSLRPNEQDAVDLINDYVKLRNLVDKYIPYHGEYAGKEGTRVNEDGNESGNIIKLKFDDGEIRQYIFPNVRAVKQ